MANQFSNPDLVQQENPQMEELRRELARRSQDRVKVTNPLDYDREVIWNRFVNLVPAHQEVVLPRYIGEKYVKEMVDHMITVSNEQRVIDENKRRRKTGQKDMDAQERELFDWRVTDKKLRKKYIPKVYLGVVEEYGKSQPANVLKEDEPVYAEDTDLLAEIDSNQISKSMPVGKPEPELRLTPKLDEMTEAKKKAAVKKVAQ